MAAFPVDRQTGCMNVWRGVDSKVYPAGLSPLILAKVMKSGFLFFFLLLAGTGVRLQAQHLPDIERLLEENGMQATAGGYEEMVNALVGFFHSPLNINTADFDSLKLLFLLSDGQIDQLLVFRRKYGNFLHLNELLLVPGIGRQDLMNIRPFITLGEPKTQDRMAAVKALAKQELIVKVRGSLPLQEGYREYRPRDFDKQKDYEKKVEQRFQGPPVGTCLKYKLGVGQHLQLGLTGENDPGEAYFTRYQKKGFDFLSAYVGVTAGRFLRKLVLGDYRLQWGQGLMAWNGFASGKSDVAVGNEKAGKGFAGCASTDENNYLRGAAVSVQLWPSWTVELFFSKKRTDANLMAKDTAGRGDWVSASLYESGYHRNLAECRKKGKMKELAGGFSCQWNTAAFKIGANALYYDFTPALIPGKRLYQQYNDTGKDRLLLGVDYKTGWRGMYVFGETAWSNGHAWATVNGLRWAASWISGCVLYRYYDKKYHSHYAAGFGEYSNTSNEEGVYAGADCVPLKNLKINLYYDWFRFFSPRYRATVPKAGYELLGQAVYHARKWEQVLRIKYERKPEDVKGKPSAARRKTEYRYQLACRWNQRWECRTRLSAMHYVKEERREWGYMVYADLIYATRHADFKMQCRLAWFDTDSYDSRIYTYEHNVLYGYAFPAFMGKGWRTYLNMSWKPLRQLTLYLKAGLTVRPGIDHTGSGVTEVQGSRLGDLALQVRLNF